MTAHARLAMVATAAMAALMAASVRVFRLEFEGMYIDWQLSEDDLVSAPERACHQSAVGQPIRRRPGDLSASPLI